jgi:hypothetical protein
MSYGDKMIDSNKIIIIRAENGWILEREQVNDFEESTFTVRDVFEDGNGGLDNRVGRADSLSNLLWEAFSPEYQSRFAGGLSVDVKERGSVPVEEISLETSKEPENRPKNSHDPLNVEKTL